MTNINNIDTESYFTILKFKLENDIITHDNEREFSVVFDTTNALLANNTLMITKLSNKYIKFISQLYNLCHMKNSDVKFQRLSSNIFNQSHLNTLISVNFEIKYNAQTASLVFKINDCKILPNKQ